MILLVYLLYPFHGQINGCGESTASVLGVGRSGGYGGGQNLISESRNGGSKTEGEESSGFGNKPAKSTQVTQPSEPPPKQNYVHVQARRGQATDSHSLDERIKYLSSLYMQFWQLIKKRKYELEKKRLVRMKILQDLVLGCNKVIGKALVLDEIINYIQSLQRQVEFLSMKLEAVNSRVAPSNDGYPARDASQSMALVFLMPFWLQLMAGE
ncbi:hypothetical protein MKX03_025472 [Papaver bracteatum]|nr:hypothetical protein MKX03_025472 [Papaver bracteatum]